MRAVLFALLALAVPGLARGDSCKEAFTSSSKLAGQGKLLAAEAELRTCAAAQCPEAMRAVCVHDLEALSPRIPTIVLAAVDRATGRDVTDVRVTLDGRLLEERLDGVARPVDPGPHTFAFDRGGATLGVTSVLIKEGEKARLITLDIGVRALDDEASRRPVPLAAWIAGGVGVVALGVWAGTGIDGFVKESELDACKARGCPVSQVQSTERMFNAADIAGATALVAAAVATVVFFTRPTVKPSRLGVGIGRGLVVMGSF